MILIKPLIVSLMALLSACATYDRVYGPGSQGPAPVERSQPAIVSDNGSNSSSERQVYESTATGVASPSADTGAIDETRNSQPPQDSPLANPRDTSPTGSLLTSARSAAQAGELERAAAITERALSISPRDPVIWYELARIRSLQQRYGEADGLARRALSMTGADRGLRREIESLLDSIARLRE